MKVNSVMLDSARVHVHKVKPGKRTKVFMTPTIRAAIRKRNKLRGDIKERKREWLEACGEVNEAITEAKQESWKEILEEALTEADERKIWNVAKQLNGTPDTNTPNEVLVHKGKRVVSHRKKADCFIEHYADVSRNRFSGNDKTVNRDAKILLKEQTAEEKNCKAFSMQELKSALKK